MKTFGKSYYDALFYLGIVFGIVVAFNRRYDFLPPFAVGILAGLALTFMLVAGSLRFNKSRMEQAETNRNDERLQLIRGKAHETAYYVLLGAGVIAIFVFALIGERFIDVAVTIAATVFFLFLASEIAYRVYEKRM
jgi:uncharacterized membrane protein